MDPKAGETPPLFRFDGQTEVIAAGWRGKIEASMMSGRSGPCGSAGPAFDLGA